MFWLLNLPTQTPTICTSVQAVSLYTGIPTDTLYSYFSRKKAREFNNDQYRIVKLIPLRSGDIDPQHGIKTRISELLAMNVDYSTVTGDDIAEQLTDQDADGECQGVNVEPFLRLQEELGGAEEVAKLLQYAHSKYHFWYNDVDLQM